MGGGNRPRDARDHGEDTQDDEHTASCGWYGDDIGATVLAATIAAMGWRLREAATRIDEAAAALGRGDGRRALDRLFEIEPLVFDAGRVLSATFLLARETNGAAPEG